VKVRVILQKRSEGELLAKAEKGSFSFIKRKGLRAVLTFERKGREQFLAKEKEKNEQRGVIKPGRPFSRSRERENSTRRKDGERILQEGLLYHQETLE